MTARGIGRLRRTAFSSADWIVIKAALEEWRSARRALLDFRRRLAAGTAGNIEMVAVLLYAFEDRSSELASLISKAREDRP